MESLILLITFTYSTKAGSDLGQIASGKPVGAQIGTNFQNQQITGRDSICS